MCLIYLFACRIKQQVLDLILCVCVGHILDDDHGGAITCDLHLLESLDRITGNLNRLSIGFCVGCTLISICGVSLIYLFSIGCHQLMLDLILCIRIGGIVDLDHYDLIARDGLLLDGFNCCIACDADGCGSCQLANLTLIVVALVVLFVCGISLEHLTLGGKKQMLNLVSCLTGYDIAAFVNKEISVIAQFGHCELCLILVEDHGISAAAQIVGFKIDLDPTGAFIVKNNTGHACIEISIFDINCARCIVHDQQACFFTLHVETFEIGCRVYITQSDAVCGIGDLDVLGCEACERTAGVNQFIQIITFGVPDYNVVNMAHTDAVAGSCALCACECTAVNSDVTCIVVFLVHVNAVVVHNKVDILNGQALILVACIAGTLNSQGTCVGVVSAIKGESHILFLLDGDIFSTVIQQSNGFAVLDFGDGFGESCILCFANSSNIAISSKRNDRHGRENRNDRQKYAQHSFFHVFTSLCLKFLIYQIFHPAHILLLTRSKGCKPEPEQQI